MKCQRSIIRKMAIPILEASRYILVHVYRNIAIPNQVHIFVIDSITEIYYGRLYISNLVLDALYNDIALLILDVPINDSYEHIGYICLPPAGEAEPDSHCFASGWGKDVFGSIGSYQTILKKVKNMNFGTYFGKVSDSQSFCSSQNTFRISRNLGQ